MHNSCVLLLSPSQLDRAIVKVPQGMYTLYIHSNSKDSFTSTGKMRQRKIDKKEAVTRRRPAGQPIESLYGKKKTKKRDGNERLSLHWWNIPASLYSLRLSAPEPWGEWKLSEKANWHRWSPRSARLETMAIGKIKHGGVIPIWRNLVSYIFLIWYKRIRFHCVWQWICLRALLLASIKIFRFA